MKDRVSEASEELQEKSAFVCTSCGHPNDIVKVREQLQGTANVDYHDRFSDAVKEEGEKSAFTCESCGHHQIVNKE